MVATTTPSGDATTDRIEVLSWDSEFFDMPIGRVDLDGADAAALDAIEAEARSLGLACLYGSLDPADAAASVLVQRWGHRLVEVATTFSLRLDEPPIPEPPGIHFRLGTPDDLPAMEPAAEALAPWSRFGLDPRFDDDAALRLQRAWMARAAHSETGEHQLVVAEHDGEVVASITRCANPEPRVDSVWTSAQGSGAARHLIELSRRWAGDRPLLGGPIAARNVHALRYVSHCGYRVSSVRYLYHRWLDEG